MFAIGALEEERQDGFVKVVVDEGNVDVAAFLRVRFAHTALYRYLLPEIQQFWVLYFSVTVYKLPHYFIVQTIPLGPLALSGSLL